MGATMEPCGDPWTGRAGASGRPRPVDAGLWLMLPLLPHSRPASPCFEVRAGWAGLTGLYREWPGRREGRDPCPCTETV